MNYTRKLLVAAVVAACSMPVGADDHDDYMINMTELSITMGHGMEFNEGMTAYRECYAENNGENSWSVWNPIGGSLNRVLMVSRMDSWGEMAADDEASQACWSIVREEIWPHMDGVDRRFARRVADWSGDAEGYTVVRLHNFRVDDGRAFREVASEMTGMMKEADDAELGTWYSVIDGGYWGTDYFVVDHYDDFAAMDDDDRVGVNDVMVRELGEDGAQEMWDRFGDTLEDNGYSSEVYRRSSDLSFSPSDD